MHFGSYRPFDDDYDPDDCHGFLLATYAHDFAGATEMYLRRFQNDRDSPATIIGNADPEGTNFLQHAHDRVISASNDHSTTLAPPEFAVIANWNIATPGAGAGWHG